MLSFPRIVHVSDLHASSSTTQLDLPDIVVHHDTLARMQTLTTFLEQNQARLAADMILHTGDITDCGDEVDFLVAKAAFVDAVQGYTLLNVPGNHDYFCHGANCIFPPFGPSPDSEGGQSRTRKQNFEKYISGYTGAYPRIIPALGNPDVGWFVLLDSMAGIFGQHNSWAQGCLGAAQLGVLRQFLNAPETVQRRSRGARIVVALHHSPFATSDEDWQTGMQDALEFLEAIAGRIDVLLFGHKTSRGALTQEFSDREQEWMIPLISCVNLQGMDSPPTGKVVVVDIEQGLRESYLVSGGPPTTSFAAYPVRPRQHKIPPVPPQPSVSGACHVLGSRFDHAGRILYDVLAMATTHGFTQPVTYTWLVDPNTAATTISGPLAPDPASMVSQVFDVKLGAPGGPCTYDHSVLVTATDGTLTASCSISIALPRPSLTFDYPHESSAPYGPVQLTPVGLAIKRPGIEITYSVHEAVTTVRALCHNLFGTLAFKWSPEPVKGQGTDTATYDVILNAQKAYKVVAHVVVSDEYGQTIEGSAVLWSHGILQVVPKDDLPLDVQKKLSWDKPETIVFDDPGNARATVHGVPIEVHEGVLHKPGTIQIAGKNVTAHEPVHLLHHAMGPPR